MKKVLMTLTSLFLFAALSMSFVTNSNSDDNQSIRKSYCTIKVKNSSGSAASNVKVVGSVCGGISCVGNTKAFYTDSDGEVTISWSDGCNLCYVYIDGKEYRQKCKDGGSYTFTK